MNIEGPTQSIRLMLVDDEERFREVVGHRLARRGLCPVQAANGEECLGVLEKTPMDVIVMDVKMPGLDGIATLKIIKETHPETEVILLTGNAAVSDGIQGINAGAFDYLTKPIEIDHLANKIHQAYDIILRKREKEAEADLLQRLERKMIVTDRLASLGTLSTGIAHEINNPLAIINESAGFMRAVLSAPEMEAVPKLGSLMSALDKVDRSIERARKITHQLLGYVRTQKVEQSETEIHLLVDETLTLLKKEIQGKSITVVLDRNPQPVRIWSDPSQIRQVLVNLLTNAVHAVGVKGRITVSARETDGWVNLVIQDNGSGIPREHMKKIFDPFFSTKPANEGTGLGLFVAHRILAGLGGDINVESTAGSGTTITMRLPLCRDRDGKPAPASDCVGVKPEKAWLR